MENEQKAKTFDQVTLEKIKKSALISGAGFLVAVIPLLLPQSLEMLKEYPVMAALVASLGAFTINAIKEWLKGV